MASKLTTKAHGFRTAKKNIFQQDDLGFAPVHVELMADYSDVDEASKKTHVGERSPFSSLNELCLNFRNLIFEVVKTSREKFSPKS